MLSACLGLSRKQAPTATPLMTQYDARKPVDILILGAGGPERSATDILLASSCVLYRLDGYLPHSSTAREEGLVRCYNARWP